MFTIGTAVVIGGRSTAYFITDNRMVSNTFNDTVTSYKLLYSVQSSKGLFNMLESISC